MFTTLSTLGLPSSTLRRLLATATAMTFGDDIVFADEPAAKDACLWAHELEHVKQYGRLGVAGFARRFALASASLEQPAYDQQAVGIALDELAHEHAELRPLDHRHVVGGRVTQSVDEDRFGGVRVGAHWGAPALVGCSGAAVARRAA